MLADAEAAGLKGWVALTDTGSDTPGVLLEFCSPQFQRRFSQADLIIAKGQGNFEALHGCEKDIFFLFKAKCSTVARHIGYPMGSLVIHCNRQANAGLRPGKTQSSSSATFETIPCNQSSAL